jgi:hypothetical protein
MRSNRRSTRNSLSIAVPHSDSSIVVALVGFVLALIQSWQWIAVGAAGKRYVA